MHSVVSPAGRPLQVVRETFGFQTPFETPPRRRPPEGCVGRQASPLWGLGPIARPCPAGFLPFRGVSRPSCCSSLAALPPRWVRSRAPWVGGRGPAAAGRPVPRPPRISLAPKLGKGNRSGLRVNGRAERTEHSKHHSRPVGGFRFFFSPLAPPPRVGKRDFARKALRGTRSLSEGAGPGVSSSPSPLWGYPGPVLDRAWGRRAGGKRVAGVTTPQPPCGGEWGVAL